MRNVTDQEIKATLAQFSSAQRDVYDSYAFAVGFYESLLVEFISELPKKKQLALIESIARITPAPKSGIVDI